MEPQDWWILKLERFFILSDISNPPTKEVEFIWITSTLQHPGLEYTSEEKFEDEASIINYTHASSNYPVIKKVGSNKNTAIILAQNITTWRNQHLSHQTRRFTTIRRNITQLINSSPMTLTTGCYSNQIAKGPLSMQDTLVYMDIESKSQLNKSWRRGSLMLLKRKKGKHTWLILHSHI